MASQAQISANRSNATLSTGPRTPEGKAVSSQNSLKFGLTAKQIVLPGENVADFEDLLAGILQQVDPANDCERMFAQDIAAAKWRVDRIERIKASVLANIADGARPERRDLALFRSMNDDEMRKFDKHLAAERRAYDRAWRLLRAMQKERKTEVRAAQKSAPCQIEPNFTRPEPVKAAVATATSPIQSPPAPLTASSM
jgi:hypothetical protein